jgi:uncharacterized protein (DUF302 family)
MSQIGSSYTLSTATELPFSEAVARAREELAREGFGVLCEIDVQATLKEKLGVEREPYLILGACNPPLAHRALETEPELGVLLPCNVVVYQEQGQTHVAAVDAERMLSIVENEELAATAGEVRRRLEAVVQCAAASQAGPLRASRPLKA